MNNGGFLVHLTDQEVELTKKLETSKTAADRPVKNVCCKTERWHRIGAFAGYDNNQRYHEGLNSVTPADVTLGASGIQSNGRPPHSR